MFQNTFVASDKTERGQVGIGTLIVFIALVLVAAIAAGVLINTAGFLQTQAEQTGQESTSQVSNTIQIESVVGENTGSGSIDTVTLTLSLGPGSEPIDLSDAQLQLITDSGANTVSDLDGTDTTLTEISGNGDKTILANTGDRTELELVLDAGNEITVGALGAGAEAEIIITTADGAQTTAQLSVPNPLQSPTEL
jgi:flagellin FlaB